MSPRRSALAPLAALVLAVGCSPGGSRVAAVAPAHSNTASSVTPSAASAAPPMRIYALLVSEPIPSILLPTDFAVEAIDLATLTTVWSSPLGRRNVPVSSFAVSRGGDRVYVVDDAFGGVRAFDGPTGVTLGAVFTGTASDCVLSADDATLYVGADGWIVEISTATLAVTGAIATGSGVGLGLGLSPDGKTLGVVATDLAQTSPTLWLVDTAGFTLRGAASISDPGAMAYASPNPTDVVLTDAGRALLWDSSYGNIYEVDIATATQDTSATLRPGKAYSFNFDNALAFSARSGRAYALTHSRSSPNDFALDVIDPLAPAATAAVAYAYPDVPIVPAATPDGSEVFISVAHTSGGDTLDRFDTATGAIQRGIYTLSRNNMRVRDLVIR